MGRCRIVTPESVRLPLSDGDFLTVKKELNAGEYHALVTEGAAGKPFAVVIAYLVGWSLVGLGDQPIAYSLTQSGDERRDVLGSLDVPTIVEIVAALDAHQAANERAIQEKKTIPEPVPA
jgi:hypothetical protein